jgi:hypothetical protein
MIFFRRRDSANRRAFDDFSEQALDPKRRYRSACRSTGGINMFARNLTVMALGRFIGVLHTVARLHGKRLQDILEARTLEEQRLAFDRTIAPLFDNRFVKFLSRMPVSYYGLGIPPAQYDELVAASSDGNPVTTLRERVERLACDFPIEDNYFAWQAFGRGYDIEGRIAVPAYLKAENYGTIKARVNRVEVHHASMTDFLKAQPARSLHRYVLLDAQDWMTLSSHGAGCRSTAPRMTPDARHLPHRGRGIAAAEKAFALVARALDLSGTGKQGLPCRRPVIDLWRLPRLCETQTPLIESGKDAGSDAGHAVLMDRVYRHQRHVYDLTRKYYLLGRDRLVRELGARPGESIVEVGCGTARNLIRIAGTYPEVRLYGLDASAEMLRSAKDSVERASLNERIVLRHGLAEDLNPAFFGRRFRSRGVLVQPDDSDWRGRFSAAADSVRGWVRPSWISAI